jgi:hypothetical protein
MMKEDVFLKGTVEVTINGELAETIPNMVVATGKALVIDHLTRAAAPIISFMGVGSSTTAPDVADIGLGEPVARAATSVTIDTTATTNDTANFLSLFNLTGTIAETGLFTAETGGIMLSHANIGPYTLTPADDLVITWKVQAV